MRIRNLSRFGWWLSHRPNAPGQRPANIYWAAMLSKRKMRSQKDRKLFFSARKLSKAENNHWWTMFSRLRDTALGAPRQRAIIFENSTCYHLLPKNGTFNALEGEQLNFKSQSDSGVKKNRNFMIWTFRSLIQRLPVYLRTCIIYTLYIESEGVEIASCNFTRKLCNELQFTTIVVCAMLSADKNCVNPVFGNQHEPKKSPF